MPATTRKKLRSRKAHYVFVPLALIKDGPPLGFTSWKQPGAILQFLRQRKIDAEEFVNWTKERIGGAGSPHIGYRLYFIGPEPTEKQRQRFLTP
jgi:hypothetical protein